VFRILAIDGGGMRGLIPATVLAELELRAGKPIDELFDLVAATSTGALIGLALMRSGPDGRPAWTAAEMAASYQLDGRRFFATSPWRTAWTLNGLLAAKYSTRPLDRELAKWMGDEMMSRCRKHVLVICYDIVAREPYVFASEDVATGVIPDQRMRLVARCSSAGPTFFAPARVDINGKRHWFVDGAFAANNPAMYAYARARRAGHQDVVVVSLGTGSVTARYMTPLIRAGALLGWVMGAHGRLLPNALIDGQSDAVAEQLRQLLPSNRCFRFNVDLDTALEAIDDASPANIAALHRAAASLVAQHSRELDTVVKLLA
jgi:uncharacterized protein